MKTRIRSVWLCSGKAKKVNNEETKLKNLQHFIVLREQVGVLRYPMSGYIVGASTIKNPRFI